MEVTIQASEAVPPLAPIDVPYLLVLFPVGFVRDDDGRWFIEPLWAKDLIEHTRYLPQLTLISHLLPDSARTPDWVDMATVPALRGVRCVAVPRPRSVLHALSILPGTWWTLWSQARRHVVVHSGFSWPIGEGWLLASMQWLHRNFQVVNIESAAWRLVPGAPSSWRNRLRARLCERLNRYCTNAADLAIFTQEEYRKSLRTRRPEDAHVIEATWIDEEWIVDDAALAAREEAIRARGAQAPLRLMFAGRLTAAKGVEWLVGALASMSSEDRARVHVNIFGDGALAGALAEAIDRIGLQAQVRLAGQLSYGAPFLEALRSHDMLIVPSLSDEQPRVVYDAYSQGVPVLASATPGLAQCVEDAVSGWLFPVGDAAALGRVLLQCAADPEARVRAGRAAAAVARRRTHREMHRRRWQLLQAALAKWQGGARRV